MAAEQEAAATGVDVGDGLRRRNVPTQGGAARGQLEADDKKKTQVQQVRRRPWSSKMRMLKNMALTYLLQTAVFPANPRSVGVDHCAPDLYRTCLLHASIQNRPLQHCDLGRSSVCYSLKIYIRVPRC